MPNRSKNNKARLNNFQKLNRNDNGQFKISEENNNDINIVEWCQLSESESESDIESEDDVQIESFDYSNKEIRWKEKYFIVLLILKNNKMKLFLGETTLT